MRGGRPGEKLKEGGKSRGEKTGGEEGRRGGGGGGSGGGLCLSRRPFLVGGGLCRSVRPSVHRSATLTLRFGLVWIRRSCLSFHVNFRIRRWAPCYKRDKKKHQTVSAVLRKTDLWPFCKIVGAVLGCDSFQGAIYKKKIDKNIDFLRGWEKKIVSIFCLGRCGKVGLSWDLNEAGSKNYT